MRHGGQILVQALRANGVTRVFSVPGESFLAVLAYFVVIYCTLYKTISLKL